MNDEDVRSKDRCDQTDGNKEYRGDERTAARMASETA